MQIVPMGSIGPHKYFFNGDLGPSYGNALVERCFWKKEKPGRNTKSVYMAMSLRTHP